MGQERKVTPLLAALALLPATTGAEPGEAIRYLMEEPASLMDVGFIRLNAYLRENADTITAALNEQDPVTRFSSVQIAAEYYPTSDEITILVAGFTDRNPSPAGCQDVIKVLRTIVPKLLEDSFTHYAHQSEDQPDELVAELSDRTHLACSVHRPMSPDALVEVSEALNGESGNNEDE